MKYRRELAEMKADRDKWKKRAETAEEELKEALGALRRERFWIEDARARQLLKEASSKEEK